VNLTEFGVNFTEEFELLSLSPDDWDDGVGLFLFIRGAGLFDGVVIDAEEEGCKFSFLFGIGDFLVCAEWDFKILDGKNPCVTEKENNRS